MTKRVGMSQVKFKVRHNALLLREFTVADIVRATNLKPNSVRTELQRMKNEGLLTSRLHPDKPKRRGGRPALYELTDDPEARLALSESIEAFYLQPSPSEWPTSRHYLLAQRLLDRIQAMGVPRPPKRLSNIVIQAIVGPRGREVEITTYEKLLADAERELEMAEHAEGGSLAPELVRAYLAFERTRLAYLRDENEAAESSFEELREFFVGAQDETMINRIDEFQLCLQARKRFIREKLDSADEAALASCLLDTLDENDYQTDSPLTALLRRLTSSLLRLSVEVHEPLRFDFSAQAAEKIGWKPTRVYTRITSGTGEDEDIYIPICLVPLSPEDLSILEDVLSSGDFIRIRASGIDGLEEKVNGEVSEKYYTPFHDEVNPNIYNMLYEGYTVDVVNKRENGVENGQEQYPNFIVMNARMAGQIADFPTIRSIFYSNRDMLTCPIVFWKWHKKEG